MAYPEKRNGVLTGRNVIDQIAKRPFSTGSVALRFRHSHPVLHLFRRAPALHTGAARSLLDRVYHAFRGHSGGDRVLGVEVESVVGVSGSLPRIVSTSQSGAR